MVSIISHFWLVAGCLISYGEQLLLVLGGLYGPAAWFIKLSLFVLYLEIFGLIKWLRYGAYTGIVITGLFYFVLIIPYVVLCGPEGGRSQLSYLEGSSSQRCAQSRAEVLTLGIVNVVSDLYLLALPLPALWSLQMPIRKKLGVAAMILTGLV